MQQGRYSTRGRELLEAIEAVVQEACKKNLPGSDEKTVAKIGKDVSYCLANQWGGQMVYMPQDTASKHAAIYADFTGDNHSELAEKYNLSVPHIYQIVAQERERRKHKQTTLPGLEVH